MIYRLETYELWLATVQHVLDCNRNRMPVHSAISVVVPCAAGCRPSPHHQLDERIQLVAPHESGRPMNAGLQAVSGAAARSELNGLDSGFELASV
jgi:hypothetical protein